MINLKILHSALYRQEQKFTQISYCTFLGLNISGLHYCTWRHCASGSLLGCKHRGDSSFPFLILIPAGTKIDFEYGSNRENWMIACEIPSLRYEVGKNGMSLNYRNCELSVPVMKRLKPSQVGALRTLFAEITELSQSGIPQQLCAAELKMGAVLSQFFLSASDCAGNERENPARLFKSLIDADIHFRKSLSLLSSEAGYSREHMRVLFLKQYRTDPAKYRQQYRLHEILRLMSETNLNLKEITDQVGMRNPTHLYSFLKKLSPASPKELLNQYRG